MAKINNDIFQSIKNTLQNKSAGGTGYENILKLEAGNTYLVRLLPNVKDPENTFFRHYIHDWKDIVTGKYTSVLSLQTFDERDPIAEYRFKVNKEGTEAAKEDLKKRLRRVEKWMVNVYVINDPTNSENNGKVKILRYGKQLAKIVASAIDGEDATELGPKVFDLGPEGVNLRIKVELQAEFPTFTSSKFTMPSAIPGLTDPDKVLDSVFDLRKFHKVMSFDEIKKLFDRSFVGKSDVAGKTTETVLPETKPTTPVKEKATTPPVTVPTDVSEDELENLLSELTNDK